MSEQQDKAADLGQRYVQEYDETEELVEGLDPASEGSGDTTEAVKGAAADSRTEEQVERMSGEP